MSRTPEAAVTAWAWYTPLGDAQGPVLARLCAGERAARANPRFPADTYGCRLAAAIAADPPRTRHDRVLRRMGRFGYQAACDAFERSGAGAGPRLGLFAGVGGLRAHWDDIMPALAGQSDDFANSWQRGFRRIHPFWMLQHLSNNAHALLSMDLGARGEGATFGGANAGAQALSAAIESLADGAIDAAVVVAYDSLLEPETIVEMTARGACTRCAPGEMLTPGALAAPYDVAARGFVPGEAAAAMVLVADAGEGVGFRIRAATAGDGSAGPPGKAALRAAIERVMARDLEAPGGQDAHDARRDAESPARQDGFASGASEGPIAFDGAAIAAPEFDRGEREVLAAVAAGAGHAAGHPAGRPADLTAVQAAMGQLGAAAPLVQAIAMAGMLQRGTLAPIAGLAAPADGPLAPLQSIASSDARTAICVSAGAPGLAGAVRVTLD